MFGKLGSFFGESKQELSKVNWPTREELTGSTILVIVVTLMMSAFIFVIDIVLSYLLRVVLY